MFWSYFVAFSFLVRFLLSFGAEFQWSLGLMEGCGCSPFLLFVRVKVKIGVEWRQRLQDFWSAASALFFKVFRFFLQEIF
ncbi:hypothetical protein A4A49_05301 [Nicotiana attenuata]|uniref:Secreted protein n=1 Tax=Nicotiana attenuata TaxID=49451 RepID=A0A1J6IRR0_NICAT|nr:hypothetical protein A4A49_05301 [Nicotiana attenuata]